MSKAHPSVEDQFEDIRDQTIKRMVRDGMLLMYLSKAWYSNPSGTYSECISFISEGYEIGIKKLGKST